MKRALVAAMAAALLLTSIAGAQEEPSPAATESSIGVPALSFCTEVQEREPVGESGTFAEDVGTVCCYTQITGVEGESAVTHVWYHAGTEISRVELPVRSAAWRTWSCKTIAPGATGTWRVEVLAADGNVLRSGEFTVGAASGM